MPAGDTQPREVEHYLSHGKDLFAEWIEGLKDFAAVVAIQKRIDRVEDGNFGDHGSVGKGVWELRIDFGPGYRVYFGLDGPKVVLLLCGGDKSRQKKDIRAAQGLWAEYERLK